MDSIINKQKIFAVLSCFVFLFIIFFLVRSFCASAAVTQSEIDELKESAAELEKQKNDLGARLEKLEDKIYSALDQKIVIEQQVNLVEDQIATTEALIMMLDEKILQEEVNLVKAQEEEKVHFEAFCKRVRVMEEQGTISYWRVLFGAEDYIDLLDRVTMINAIVEYDNAVAKSLEEAREATEETKTALELVRVEQLVAKETLNAQKIELSEKKATINSLLAELQSKQNIYKDQIEELESASIAMDKEIAALQEEYERQRAASQLQIETGSGYVWPLDGCYVLTSLFGPREHPITFLPGNHGGTDVRAGYGTTIKAARGGQVIKSEYHWSYGNYVVVDHCDGVTTLYAHMSKRSVSVGDIVSQGQKIGEVGSTGSSTGNHLHFEIRIKNVRVDAIDYYPGLDFWVVYDGKLVPLKNK